jgi:Glycine zipper
MKKLTVLFLAFGLALAAGCTTAGRNTGPGVLLGSALGAGAGAIIGHQTGNAESGALIGAGVGGLTGGLIGNAMDRTEQDAAAQDAAIAASVEDLRMGPERLSILDVIRLSQSGVSDQVIIAKIDQSGATYRLSTSEILDLRRSHVSDPVIAHMLRTEEFASARTTPVYRPVEAVTYRPIYRYRYRPVPYRYR